MKITLFVPCYVDAMFPKAAWSVVRVLEKLGHEIHVPKSITCCGQPPFNSGYWNEARQVAVPVLQILGDAEAVVVPSGATSVARRPASSYVNWRLDPSGLKDVDSWPVTL